MRYVTALCLLLLAAPAAAVPSVIPYDGVLAQDGVLVDGRRDMRFTVYTAPTDGEVVFRDTFDDVAISDGRFSVYLGEGEDIADLSADGSPFFIGVEVKAADYTALVGRQRVNPVAHALWSRHAPDLVVADAVVVDRDADLEGDLEQTAGTLFAGALIGSSLTLTDDDAGSLTVAGTFDVGTLQIGDIDADAVIVTGDLSVGGDVTGPGVIYVNHPGESHAAVRISDGDLVFNPGGFGDTEIEGPAAQLGTADDPTTVAIAGAWRGDGDARLGAVDGNALRGAAVTVDGALAMDGGLAARNCRLCINYGTDDGSGSQRFLGARMAAGESTGALSFPGDVGSDSAFELIYKCDLEEVGDDGLGNGGGHVD